LDEGPEARVLLGQAQVVGTDDPFQMAHQARFCAS
jgi:hypothetical protein